MLRGYVYLYRLISTRDRVYKRRRKGEGRDKGMRLGVAEGSVCRGID